jgi:N-acetylmuramic acid 6-phosphate etherase
MITTTTMIKLGKVYENMMVDLQLTNRKLKERALRIIMTATGIDYESAGEVLTKANGHVKTALVMIKTGVTAKEAKKKLKAAQGFVRTAIAIR